MNVILPSSDAALSFAIRFIGIGVFCLCLMLGCGTCTFLEQSSFRSGAAKPASTPVPVSYARPSIEVRL